MVRIVNYTVTQGVPFERLLIVKNRRNRRVLKPLQAKAALRTPAGHVMPIEATITSEWGIRLYMDEYRTTDLPLGECQWDALAYMSPRSIPSAYYEPAGDFWQPVAKGTLTVGAFDTITSPEDPTMLITYKQRTDLRRRFSWFGEGSLTPVVVEDAYLVAVNAADELVTQLNWSATPLSEAQLALLPASRRGYLSPSAGYSLEMHISDQATLPVGDYRFSLMVRSAGDWEELVNGTLRVEFSPASLAITT